MVQNETLDTLIGLPWQLAERFLQAASIPFITVWGKNYNRFFDVSQKSPYVARIRKTNEDQDKWEVLLYYPMISSDFSECSEVEYVKFPIEKEK